MLSIIYGHSASRRGADHTCRTFQSFRSLVAWKWVCISGVCGCVCGSVVVRYGECGARGRAAPSGQEDEEEAGAGCSCGRGRFPRWTTVICLQWWRGALGSAHIPSPTLQTLRSPGSSTCLLCLRCLSCHRPLALRWCQATDCILTHRNGQRFGFIAIIQLLNTKKWH